MGSVSLAEIVVIAAVVLIIFGPDRLPEIARKGAEIIRKSRQATSELTSSLKNDYGDVIAPINEVRQELQNVRRDLTAAATSLSDETSSLSKELKSTLNVDPIGREELPPASSGEIVAAEADPQEGRSSEGPSGAATDEIAPEVPEALEGGP